MILQNPYIKILKSRLQKTSDAIKDENQSAAIKKVEQFDILFLLFVTILIGQSQWKISLGFYLFCFPKVRIWR